MRDDRKDSKDDALFGRLRHLVQAAKTMQQRDRRSVLALAADIRRLRGELDARRQRLGEQMRAASTRTTAINAYARIRSMAPGPIHRPTNPTE
jgi:hypothetical protein